MFSQNKNKNKVKMVGLADIPEEVISHHLLQHLGLNELLRLRLVSKYYKCLADDFMNLNVVTKQEVLISNNKKDGFGFGFHFEKKDRDPEKLTRRQIKMIELSELMELPMKIPTSHFVFEYNLDNDIFRDRRILDFVKTYGKQITHLKINHMILPITKKKERKFYEGLPNLKDLTIQYLRVAERARKKDLENLYIPPVFKNLTRLSVKSYIEINKKDQHKMCYWKILKSCENLEILVQPLYSILNIKQVETDMVPHFGSFSLNELKKIINDRNLPKLRCLDMFYMDFHGPDLYWRRLEETDFVPFLSACFQNHIHLQNFPDALLAKLPEGHFQKATLCITSVKGFTPNILRIDLPHLNRICINTEDCYMTGNPDDVGNNFFVPTQTWPNLETIKVTVGSVMLSNGFRNEEEWVYPTTLVWNQLFGEVWNIFERPSVKDLSIIFTKPNRMIVQAIPRCAAIANSCKMLRILSLTRWSGVNGDLRVLWKELSNLEEVTFDQCESLNINAFYGDDAAVPFRSHFANLKNLKKLSFYNLHEMSGISDPVFQKVFCHMKLQHFYLESKFLGQIINLRAITLRSMKALVEGEFAKTVETFPFDCWAIDGVEPKRMEKIRKMFPLLQ